MRSVGPPHLFLPIARAISQFDDPAFRGVLFRSIAWSVACFAAVHIAAIWIIHRLLELHGWLAWAGDVLGSIAVSMLSLWLFLPVAVAIGTMYFDRIALAVERRFYPWLPPPNGAPLLEQAWDGVAVALKVLALNIVALILALLLPGIGVILGWAIAAYAIGRGLFVAVAMRRMPRMMAESLYRANRGVVLAQGAVLALSAYVPVLNLLIPIVGVAAMVHVLDIALTAAGPSGR
ncbi:MAG: CysZ protein [Acetobacteraceae bacterium]|jgi:CysZ protein|nr:CysZ protein [Acetobacteraceae bacterium]